MLKETLKKNIIGTKIFGEKIDITDPCYNKDVWCRMNGVSIAPGSYACVAWTGEDPSFGHRVLIAGIYKDGKIPSQQTMKEIGDIGVDAGLAGFFEDKPDYNDKQWSEFCDSICKGEAWIKDEGFFTSSGIGDGCYGVYAHRCRGASKDGPFDAIEIRF